MELEKTLKTKKSGRKRGAVSTMTVILFAVLLLYAVSMLLPMLWGVFTALKRQNEFRTNVLLPPGGAVWTWEWANFPFIFKNFFVKVTTLGGVIKTVGMWEMVLNTVLYAGGGAFFATLTPCIVAYVTSKFNYKFSKVIYGIVIITMVLPIVGSAPSEIQLVKALHIYDTIIGSWIQKCNFLGMYFLVFFATFKGVPQDYSEAAYVDGASELKIFLRIMLPLVANVFSTIMLINFIGLWNDYQTPLLFLPSHPTLAYGIYELSNSYLQGLNNVPMRMAGCIVMVLPILALFLAFKNKLMNNVSMGGIKE